jgi:hypothetical protein
VQSGRFAQHALAEYNSCYLIYSNPVLLLFQPAKGDKCGIHVCRGVFVQCNPCDAAHPPRCAVPYLIWHTHTYVRKATTLRNQLVGSLVTLPGHYVHVWAVCVAEYRRQCNLTAAQWVKAAHAGRSPAPTSMGLDLGMDY